MVYSYIYRLVWESSVVPAVGWSSMGWHMKFVICVQLAYVSVCLTQLSVVAVLWTSFDLRLSSEDGQESRRLITSSSEIKSWLMYKDRLFVTLHSKPYTLAYLNLTDNSTSPLLRPYPSWKTNMVIGNQRIIYYYPDKVRVDRCDRLWVMSIMSENDDIVLEYYKMIVFDLKTDSILRNIYFPKVPYFLDMTVDDFECDNEYVYISNHKEVWTYSWAERDSWRHHTNILDPIGSMILAPKSIIYYNIEYESMVYYMPTTHLRDRNNKRSDITKLGRSRDINVVLALSALDAKSDNLYYFNYDTRTINAVPCWTSERCSSNGQGDIVVSIDPTHTLRYITVDENGYLWAITSRPIYEEEKIYFKLVSVPVRSTDVESNDNDATKQKRRT